MKAAPMKGEPGFGLMKDTDIQNFYHMQMPRFLFFDGKYMRLSLEAKVAYTFLLNRFQLSKLNGWTNEAGEVFIIYTRNSLAGEIGVSYRKTISAMKELSDAGLIWERRRGRGDANQIYLARVDLSTENGTGRASAPFVGKDHEAAGTIREDAGSDCGSRSAKTALLDGSVPPGSVRAAPPSAKESAICVRGMPNPRIKACENGTSKDADPACQEVPDPHTRKKDLKNKYIKNRSVGPARARESPDSRCERELDEILERCELWIFAPETASVFENAIERLYYAESYKICGATLPRERVRARLRKLGNFCLQNAEHKISRNTFQKIRDTTAYTMAVIFNSITETHSDLMHDPYLNGLRASPGRGCGERGN
jgi:hypothetical protein